MCASYGTRWRSRGDCFPRATPRRLLRSLYIGERGARARALGCHCSCFRSRLRLSFETILVSAGALLSLLSSLPPFCSFLCRLSVIISALLLSHLCLGYASRSLRSPLQYSIPSDDYGIQRKTFPKKLSAILLNSIPERSFPNLLSNDVVIPFSLFSLEKVYLASLLTCQNHFLISESNLRKLLPNWASDFLIWESRFGKLLSELGK